VFSTKSLKMTEEKSKELRENILKGLDLAYQRLQLSKQKEDGELVFYKDGNIVTVKARDLAK
jgi:phage terminase large subunit-like protein